MSYCSKCGNKVEENMAFCSRCGAPLNSGDATPGPLRTQQEEKAEKQEKNEKDEPEKTEKQEKGIWICWMVDWRANINYYRIISHITIR